METDALLRVTQSAALMPELAQGLGEARKIINAVIGADTALIVRLFGISGQPQAASLVWGGIKPDACWITDLSERPLTPTTGAIAVPAYGIVHLRVDLP